MTDSQPKKMAKPTETELAAQLRAKGISPTTQRIEVLRAILGQMEHVSADDLYTLINQSSSLVSKATVYNTVSLFVERGLIREVIADPARVFYDPNTHPHHHFYYTDSCKLVDIPAEQVQIRDLPPIPEGMQIEGVDLVIRIRPRS